MTTIGFVGLGAMGGRHRRPAPRRRPPVYGENRTKRKAAPLIELGLVWRDTPREVAEAADVVFSMVTDDARARGDRRRPRRPARRPRGREDLGRHEHRQPAASSRGSPSGSATLRGADARRTRLRQRPRGRGRNADDHGRRRRGRLRGASSRCCTSSAAVRHIGDERPGAACSSSRSTSASPRRCSPSARACCSPSAAGSTRELAVEVMAESSIGSPFLHGRAPLVLDLPDEAWFDVELVHKDIRLALATARDQHVVLPSAGLADQVLTERPKRLRTPRHRSAPRGARHTPAMKTAMKTTNTRTDRAGKIAPRRPGLDASPSGPQLAPRNSPPRRRARLGRRWRLAGTEGNEILTSAAAVVLVCLLAAEGVTIVHMRGLLSAHMFIGLVLIGPVLLKLGEHWLPHDPLLLRLAPLSRQGAAGAASPGAGTGANGGHDRRISERSAAARRGTQVRDAADDPQGVVHRVRRGLGGAPSRLRPTRCALRTYRLDRSAPSCRARDRHESDAGRRRSGRRRGAFVSASCRRFKPMAATSRVIVLTSPRRAK